MKRLSFLPKAEARLEDISEWTVLHFGPIQAESYVADLLDRCRAVAEGTAHTQSCRAVFAPDLREDLRFARAGQHFVVFIETAAEIVVVDFIHQRADLPGKLG